MEQFFIILLIVSFLGIGAVSLLILTKLFAGQQ